MAWPCGIGNVTVGGFEGFVVEAFTGYTSTEPAQVTQLWAVGSALFSVGVLWVVCAVVGAAEDRRLFRTSQQRSEGAMDSAGDGTNTGSKKVSCPPPPPAPSPFLWNIAGHGADA
jgi:hypothetical protein